MHALLARFPLWLVIAGIAGCKTPTADSTSSSVASGATPSSIATTLAPNSVAASATTLPEPQGSQLAAVAPVSTQQVRVYARNRNVWIRPEPDANSEWIGNFWWGTSLPVRDATPIPGQGCAAFYAVEPRGYVCAEGRRATTDANDPLVKQLAPFAPELSAPYPHPHYGEAMEAQRYLALPTEAEQRIREWDYTPHLAAVERARAGEIAAELTGVDLRPAPTRSLGLPQLPESLQLPHTRLIMHSSFAWTAEVRHAGRDWLLSDDLTWVPKDRVRPFATRTFHGIELGSQARLPIAFIRQEGVRAYADTGNKLEPSAQPLPRLAWLELSGDSRTQDGALFHRSTSGVWLRATDAVIPEARQETPWGEALPAPLNPPALSRTGAPNAEPPERRTWIEVSINGGWLMAYEGLKPVYVTLISAGRGGPPHGSRPTLDTGSTPTGRFTINGKFVTSTMIAPNQIVHSGVAWSQNFSGPYSIHSAYWHDDWGSPHSGGCINVSPLDGKWLFDFSEPALPNGWHSVRWNPKLGPATTLLIRR